VRDPVVNLLNLFRSAFCRIRSQRGVATAEYALLLALVVVVLIGVLTELGAVLVQRIQEIILQLGGV
jgi:Flp pilus assembly pilin Flp